MTDAIDACINNVNDKLSLSLLPFEQNLVTSTFSDDVLFVIAKGLGIERFFLTHLYLYNNSDKIVFVINTGQEDNFYFIERLKTLKAKCSLKILTASVLAKDRILIYETGGIQSVTSRILMVDLLTNRVPIDKVAGILVYHAHEVLKGFQESFILRLFREKCKNGFVKAFTDNCIDIARGGIGQLQRLIDKLYVNQVILVPRFHSDVKNCFDLHKAKFVQVSLHLPQNEKKIRTFLSDIIATCVRELKQCSQGVLAKTEEKSNIEKFAVVQSLNEDTNFELDLREKTLLLSNRQERLLADLKILRILLRKIEDLDPTSAWNYVCRIRSDKDVLENNSGWLFTSTAAAVFSTIESLCFIKQPDGNRTIIAPPKWNSLINVIKELEEKINSKKTPSNIFVVASNEQTCLQLMDLIKFGKDLLCHNLAKSVFHFSKDKGAVESKQNSPDCKPLWNADNMIYFDDQLLEQNLLGLKNQIDELQKKVGRDARKRGFGKVIDPKLASDPKQAKLVSFGIIRYSQKKMEKKKSSKLLLHNNQLFKNSQQNETNMLPEAEIVPVGMLPEDPFTDHYTTTSNTDVKFNDASNSMNEVHESNDDEDNGVEILSNNSVETEQLDIKKDIKTELIEDDDCNVEPTENVKCSSLSKLIFIPLGFPYRLLKCLEEFQPSFIILYNVDVVSTRIIETYNAQNCSKPLELYSLMYTETTEEERYLIALRNEQSAFEHLIREQGVLMMPTEYNVARESVSHLRRFTLQRDSRHNAASILEDDTQPIIVVDIREFNSELPTVLYKRGIDLSAVTLEVGDYVLSPEICVERKALDDLSQSLNNGRVFKQSEQMLRHYNKSVLLIESNEKFRQKKVNGGPFQGELSKRSRETRQLLTMLIRSNPRLSLLWSFSPSQSAELFEEITLDLPNPNVEAAVAIRSNDLGGGDEEMCEGDFNDIVNNEDQCNKSQTAKLNGVLKRQLLTLPGLLNGDVERLMRNCDNKNNETMNMGDDDGIISNVIQFIQSSPVKLGKILLNQKRANEIIELFTIDYSLTPLVL